MIQNLINFSIEQIKTNQFLSGIIGGGVAGAAMYLLRSIPSTIRTLFKKYCMYSIRIDNQQPNIYYLLNEWISSNLKFSFVRNFDIDLYYKDSAADQDYDFAPPHSNIGSKKKLIKTPSSGTNFCFYNKSPLFISKTRETQNAKGIIETIVLETPWLFKKQLDAIVKDIEQLNLDRETKAQHKIHVWNSGGYWSDFNFSNQKTFDDIILMDDANELIQADVNKFLERKLFYTSRKIKYKRGYLFYGPPGTGKSSLISAISSAIKWPIYYFNLATMTNNDFVAAFNDISKNAILAFEEVDCLSSSNTREKADGKDSVLAINLSTLLNSLDGLMSKMDVIVIMTTNYKDKLDEALIRSGRIDFKQEIGLYDRATSMKFLKKYLPHVPNNHLTLFLDGLSFPIAPSDLQEKMLKNDNFYETQTEVFREKIQN